MELHVRLSVSEYAEAMRRQQCVAAQVQSYEQGLSVIQTVRMAQLVSRQIQHQTRLGQIHQEQALAARRQDQNRQQELGQLGQIHLAQIHHLARRKTRHD